MNMFQQARTSAPAKTAKGKVEEVYVKTPGLEILAQIDALEKQLDALKKTALRPEVQDAMIDKFLENKGENYKGQEGNATASLELRRRASNSGLSDTEIEVCLKHNIPLGDIDGDFKLNVEGLTEKKLQEVSDALSKVKGLPEKFITFDASKKRTIVTDESLTTMWKINDEDTVKQIMPILGVFAIKPKTSDNMETIVKAVSTLVCPPVKKAK
jgi:hypothetical protein